MSLTICLNCFYNINDVEQTLNSIEQNKYEIVCMENPSKYEMSALFQNKNQNIKHYKCSKNIGANILTLFYWFYKNKKKTIINLINSSFYSINLNYHSSESSSLSTLSSSKLLSSQSSSSSSQSSSSHSTINTPLDVVSINISLYKTNI